MRQAIQQTVSRFDTVLDAVSDPLMPSQTAWCIIRQCVVSSVGFYIRITQPHIAHDAIKEFDLKVTKPSQRHTRCRQDWKLITIENYC